MITIFLLLTAFLAIGLFIRKFNFLARFLLIGAIVVMLLYLYLT